MAGLASLNEDFGAATPPMHLLSPSGELPLYLGKSKDGVYKAMVGKFESGDLPIRLAMNATDPVPPVCPTGWTVEPIILLIRNPDSPDADNFRKKHGKIDSAAELKAERMALHRNKAPKRYSPDEQDERDIICCAALIAGWQNMPLSTDEKKLMDFNDENAIAFLREHKVAVTQLKVFMESGKKFERGS